MSQSQKDKFITVQVGGQTTKDVKVAAVIKEKEPKAAVKAKK